MKLIYLVKVFFIVFIIRRKFGRYELGFSFLIYMMFLRDFINVKINFRYFFFEYYLI